MVDVRRADDQGRLQLLLCYEMQIEKHIMRHLNVHSSIHDLILLPLTQWLLDHTEYVEVRIGIGPQGQRTLSCFYGKDLHQEVVVPTGDLALAIDAVIQRMLL
jgi:hypothetical protein